MYRSFNPFHTTVKELFVKQLNLIRHAFNQDTLLMGDLNLDYNKKYDVNYWNAKFFDNLSCVWRQLISL